MWTALAVRRPSSDAAPGRRGTMSVLFAIARLRPGVTPLDPVSFLAAPIVLIPVALVACAPPRPIPRKAAM
jgi:hypothetical protein